MTESHYVGVHESATVGHYTEIWCPTVDETKDVLGYRYINHCPMCGEAIEVDDR